MTERHEVTVLGSELQPGDELLTTAIGGYEGKVVAVRVPAAGATVRVDLENGTQAPIGMVEVCTVLREERPRLATVHPLFRGIVKAASEMGSGPRPSGEPG